MKIRKFRRPLLASLVFFCFFMFAGTAVQLSGAAERQELQQINKLFELRYYFQWQPESLSRLSQGKVFAYHQRHDVPRSWWNWQYTLSWLIENNHPPAKLKIVIFNHEQEDEPPPEAVQDHPWMKSLLHYPMPRQEVARLLRFLATAGARVIIIDRDFPQFDQGDAELAGAMHDCASGLLTHGRAVPVFMIKSVSRCASDHFALSQKPSTPNGVLFALQKLEPDVDVGYKYAATSCLYQDQDQVVRRFVTSMPSLSDGESIIVKTLKRAGIGLPAGLPAIMDINYLAPPHSAVFPVRCQSYLLDPERKGDLLNPPQGYRDVCVRDAIVILGDSSTDSFNTPYCNTGVERMSGAEVIAQAIDSAAAGRWLQRSEGVSSLLWLAAAGAASALCVLMSRLVPVRNVGNNKVESIKFFLFDAALLMVLLCAWEIAAVLLFANYNSIVPVIVPQISMVMGFLAVVIHEREQQRADVIQQRIQSLREQHACELLIRDAQARLTEVLHDKERRREFVRKINHDLKAPLTVINWNLSKLRNDGLRSSGAEDKVERLVKTTDRLYDLLAELTLSYDGAGAPEQKEPVDAYCSLKPVLETCVKMGQSLAEMHDSIVKLDTVDHIAVASCEPSGLSRVIDNLIKNAIVHNDRGVKVTLSVQLLEKFYVIRVQDNGKGIPQEHLTKIFDSGYRVDAGDGKGTGLGLDIVKDLVERAGGKISVVSKVGFGTTFLVAVRQAESLPTSQLSLEQGSLVADVEVQVEVSGNFQSTFKEVEMSCQKC